MEIKVDRKMFTSVLRDCGKIVSSKVSLPVLTYARLETGNGSASLTTTDLDMTITSTFSCDTQPEQHVTLFPVKQAKQVLAKLKTPSVAMRNGGKELAIYSPGCGGEVRLPVWDVAEFPPAPKMTFEDVFILTQSDFKRLLKQSADCISTDESRYVLNGVYLERKDLVAHVVATDGRRLVHDEFDSVGCDIGMIIPVGCVNQLLSTLGDRDVIAIGYCKHVIPPAHPSLAAVEFEYARFIYTVKGVEQCIVAKLVQGNYPNYRQVIPEGEKLIAVVNRELFIHSLGQVALVTNDKNISVKLKFTKGFLNISAKSSMGECDIGMPMLDEWMPDESPDFLPEITEAFNPYYLIGPLSDLTCEFVELHVTDELTPIWITMTIPVQRGYKLVVMPMRLS